MALVLVEGESQIAAVVNASNANSTDATSGSTSELGLETCHRATMAAVSVLGLLLAILL